MATLDIPNRYLTLAPVIVTSPTTRCGTTLVQRLISASDNALIYGEEIGLHLKTLTSWFIGLMRQLELNGEQTDVDFQHMLDGSLRDWRPGLMPPSDVLLRAWVETYYQIPLALSDYGHTISRPIWGFKSPSFSRDTLRAFLSLMPRAKVIYVFRNPFDALKSAKARKFAVTDEQVADFCSEWARNMVEALDLRQDERVLFLKYETLTEDSRTELKRIEDFTHAENIDESQFDVKVNTFAGEEDLGYSPNQYIEPLPLTSDDRAAVWAHTGRLVHHLYGTSMRLG